MSRLIPFLVIALVLIAGCTAPAPKDTPAAPPATGSVEVASSPPGAEVYLDTVFRGTTPVTITGEPGPHTLELRLRDYQPWSKSIVIEGGARGYVDTVLMPVPVVTTPAATLPVTRTATLPTTRAQPVTEAATVPTTSPAPPPAPTPWPRTILGCYQTESYGWTGTGESFNLTEVFWFQPAGVGLINATWVFPPPHNPENSLTGFTWSRDPATQRVSVTLVGGGPPAEVYYNGNNDTITFSNRNMRPTIFPRVAC